MPTIQKLWKKISHHELQQQPSSKNSVRSQEDISWAQIPPLPPYKEGVEYYGQRTASTPDFRHAMISPSASSAHSDVQPPLPRSLSDAPSQPLPLIQISHTSFAQDIQNSNNHSSIPAPQPNSSDNDLPLSLVKQANSRAPPSGAPLSRSMALTRKTTNGVDIQQQRKSSAMSPDEVNWSHVPPLPPEKDFDVKYRKRTASTPDIRQARMSVTFAEVQVPPLPRFLSDTTQGSRTEAHYPIPVSPPGLVGDFQNGVAPGALVRYTGPPPPSSPQTQPSEGALVPNGGTGMPATTARDDSQDLEKMVQSIDNLQADKAKSDKKFIDKAGALIVKTVDTASGSSGVVGVIKAAASNEVVQGVAKMAMQSIPGLMSGLETICSMHPFAQAAFGPFKLIYKQFTKHMDNNQKRAELFEKIKDTMALLLELQTVKQNDNRVTPEGTTVLGRLTIICNKIGEDLTSCFESLFSMEKRSTMHKFFHATDWNGQLVSYAVKMQERRGDLQLTLSVRTAARMEDMMSSLDQFRQEMLARFSEMKTPQERLLDRWIKANGGEDEVMKDEKKFAELVKYEAQITSGERSSITKATSDEELKKLVAKRRKEIREDVADVIKEGMAQAQKVFEAGMASLEKELSSKIEHQGDRVIKYLSGGPHKRIVDKIMYYVWKEQDWKGSAKSRTLVLALRDYLIERVERSKKVSDTLQSPTEEKDEDEDKDMASGQPLPDEWAIEFLQMEHLDYIRQAFDNDQSGFTTIAEVNAFTASRPGGWSLPKWISYWAVGWQISATIYCDEIDDIFNQMSLIRDEIGIKMPGNKKGVNQYISGIWQHVTALTCAIERYDDPPEWLKQKYEDFRLHQEREIQTQLETFQYDIDTMETLDVILGGRPIERMVFVLLALILRRHLAKLHICLMEEMNAEELEDNEDTVTWVTEATWQRYSRLTEIFKHQKVTDMKQAFEWFSAGLFSKYCEWNDWVDPAYFKTTALSSDMSSNQVKEIDVSSLKNMLNHAVRPDLEQPEPQRERTTSGSLTAAISGKWYGFEFNDSQGTCHPMSCVDFEVDSETETKAALTITFTSTKGQFYINNGTLTVDDGAYIISITFLFEEDWFDTTNVWTGVLNTERDIICGTYSYNFTSAQSGLSSELRGSLLLKRVPEPYIMSHRPLADTLPPRQLWKFACDSIVDSIRRRRLRTQYLYHRFTQMKHLLELWQNKDRTAEQNKELNALNKSFTRGEYRELSFLNEWYNRVGNLQVSTCDTCGSDIVRSLVLCLGCKEGIVDVEFCAKVECFGATDSELEERGHQSSHLLLKTRDLVLAKDYLRIKERAQECEADVAKIQWSSLSKINTSTSVNALNERSKPVSDSGQQADHDDAASHKCLLCKETVGTPCWYCIDCEDETHSRLICDECEDKIDGLSPWIYHKKYREQVKQDRKAHNIFHLLVRVHEKETDEGDAGSEAGHSTDERFSQVRKELNDLVNMEQQVQDGITKRLTDMEFQLSRIETLLHGLTGVPKDRNCCRMYE